MLHRVLGLVAGVVARGVEVGAVRVDVVRDDLVHGRPPGPDERRLAADWLRSHGAVGPGVTVTVEVATAGTGALAGAGSERTQLGHQQDEQDDGRGDDPRTSQPAAPDELPAVGQVVVATDGPHVGRHRRVEADGEDGVVRELGGGVDQRGARVPGDVGDRGDRGVEDRGDLDGGEACDPLEDDHQPLPGRQGAEDRDQRSTASRVRRTSTSSKRARGDESGSSPRSVVCSSRRATRRGSRTPAPAGVEVGQGGLDQVVRGLPLADEQVGAALQQRPLVLDERRVVRSRVRLVIAPPRRGYSERRRSAMPLTALRRRQPARCARPAWRRREPRRARTRCAAGIRSARPDGSAWSATGCSGCAGRPRTP